MTCLQSTPRTIDRRPFVLAIMVTIVLVSHVSAICVAETIEAFTEPYLRVAVPSPENGVIKKLLVKEGDTVSKDQMLAQLNDDVLRSSLKLAIAARNAKGALLSAEAELETRKKQVESYRMLSKDGNATHRELARVEMDLNQARARFLSVNEEQELRDLEYERVKMQIRQRQLHSPIKGVVVAIEKQAGEFVSITDPVMMHIVQLDALRAVFSVPRRAAEVLERGQIVSLTLGYDSETCDGLIEFVSPIANPESNTVRVKVRIENAERKIPSGVTCQWSISNSHSRSSAASTKAAIGKISFPTPH